MDDNRESQKDEIEALTSIYGKDFSLLADFTFDLRICCDDIKWWAVTVSVLLPENYPSTEPPLYEIHTECLAGAELEELNSELHKIWEENIGNNILYVWTERIREFLFERYERAKLFIESPEEDKQREKALTDLMREQDEHVTVKIPMIFEAETPDADVPTILSSETITLKKSTFQGHSAVVKSLAEVTKVLRKLKENKKVAQASHNIVAYRIAGSKEDTYIQDYADDGEIHAGGRLLHLLQIMDVKNIVIVVSRWYGGILLGPDRFRLINNCAREAIVGLGVYEPKQLGKNSKLKKKKH